MSKYKLGYTQTQSRRTWADALRGLAKKNFVGFLASLESKIVYVVKWKRHDLLY
jgi:hypothetical protein